VDLFERAKALADQAAARTREGVEEGKLKLDLHRAYADLGKVTFELVEKGELDGGPLQDRVTRVRELETQLQERGGREPSD
jgi:hypothetical protein